MFANPDPEKAIRALDRQCTVIQRYPGRPNFFSTTLSNFLESQRRMLGIQFQQCELLISTRLRLRRQRIVKRPEPAIGLMRHRGYRDRVVPAFSSAKAFLMTSSNTPASRSAFILASTTSDSRSSIHEYSSFNSGGASPAMACSISCTVLISLTSRQEYPDH